MLRSESIGQVDDGAVSAVVFRSLNNSRMQNDQRADSAGVRAWFESS